MYIIVNTQVPEVKCTLCVDIHEKDITTCTTLLTSLFLITTILPSTSGASLQLLFSISSTTLP